MARRTKKIKSAGRYGVRYGLKLKKRIKEIDKLGKIFTCPFCLKKSVKRIASGIWFCRKCNKKFAGDAYKP